MLGTNFTILGNDLNAYSEFPVFQMLIFVSKQTRCVFVRSFYNHKIGPIVDCYYLRNETNILELLLLTVFSNICSMFMSADQILIRRKKYWIMILHNF